MRLLAVLLLVGCSSGSDHAGVLQEPTEDAGSGGAQSGTGGSSAGGTAEVVDAGPVHCAEDADCPGDDVCAGRNAASSVCVKPCTGAADCDTECILVSVEWREFDYCAPLDTCEPDEATPDGYRWVCNAETCPVTGTCYRP